MAKNKYYDPNEVDKVQAKNEAREAEINKEVKQRKQERIDRDKEHLQTIKDIHERYGYIVKEPELIAQGCKEVIGYYCVDCKILKCFPYEFMNAYKKDNGCNRCTECQKFNSNIVKKCNEKNKVDCPCGMSYYCSDLKQSKHEISRTHINGLKQLKATRLTKVYKMPELRKICSANKIKYYNTLKIDEMLEQLAKIEVIIIPEDVV